MNKKAFVFKCHGTAAENFQDIRNSSEYRFVENKRVLKTLNAITVDGL
jgi:phage protein U